jgi:hypothetical protein
MPMRIINDISKLSHQFRPNLIGNIHIDKDNKDDELMHENYYIGQADSDNHY